MLTATLTNTTSTSRPFATTTTENNTDNNNDTLPLSHIRIVPHLDTSRSLVFNVIERDIPDGTVIKIGRFTDKYLTATRITFKSKVVSRGHAEIWAKNGKFYIRDTKSSSGTFVNHVRLSPPNQESRPFLLNDGDVVQLGVDYQGGTEEIYRCVKMRLEINRPPQQRTTYSLNTFQTIRNLTTPPNNVSILDSAMDESKTHQHKKEEDDHIHVEECCICLYALAPFQSLFVAPCSHTFHYKCVRPLLVNHPGFLCPLCRSYADLDASVAVEADEVIEMYKREKQQAKSATSNSVTRDTTVTMLDSSNTTTLINTTSNTTTTTTTTTTNNNHREPIPRVAMMISNSNETSSSSDSDSDS
ncbi:hypothetical protein BJ944DRAFT_273863 [Cunninghamella echinulata]|nr:hypothetical protein BJ944DRAFT_273863 [Cunninghamella echinulata]